MPELVRAFVAVKLSGHAADQLENFLADIRPLAPIRWVHREQFHITLKFLGEVEHEVIDKTVDALEQVRHFQPFMIELNHVGAFPSLANPRVLWLGGGHGMHELGVLAGKVNDLLCDEAGIVRENKPFRAHLTLARLKNTRLPETLVRRLGDVPVISWLCSELLLMRSILTPRGPVYSHIS